MTTKNKKFKKVRLFKVSKELNVSVDTLLQHLTEKGFTDVLSGKGVNASITDEDAYFSLVDAFAQDKEIRARVEEKRAARGGEEESGDGVAAEAELAEEQLSTSEEEPSEESASEIPVEPEVEEVEAKIENEPAPEQEGESVEEADEVIAEEADEVVADEVDDVVAEEADEVVVEEAGEVVAEEADEVVVEEVDEVVAEEADAEEVPAEPEEVEEAPVVAENSAEEVPAEEPLVEEEKEDKKKPELVEAQVEVEKDPEAPVIETEVAEPTKTAERKTTEIDLENATQEEITALIESGEVAEEDLVSASRYKLEGTKIIGKIDLSSVDSGDGKRKRKRKRKRKKTAGEDEAPKKKAVTEEAPDTADKKDKAKKKKGKRKKGPVVDEAEVQQAFQETLRELESGPSRSRQKRRRRKREDHAAEREKDAAMAAEEENLLKVTEFISTGELANLMDVPVNEVIAMLFESGLMVSINQRLDADTISYVGDEFGYEIEFITEFGTEDIELTEDSEEDLLPRAPVVTVMGHVDHGKTSLLDYLRSENVVGDEAGGITQHIGAYHVEVAGGRQITFLDTPGHEAFTAMRARGASVTDVVILVVAADDSVMPQTIEAINHANAAEVPLVVAINKVDKPDSDPQKVMQGLSEHNVLVEQWGGKVQCALVSAKTGDGIEDLLDKVLLEADLLELKANPNRVANGIVIESRLDKGRGTVATILIQNGTLKVSDAFVAGIYSGRVRAMFDEFDHRVTAIGPALPALVLGFDGAPEVGDQFVVLEEEREAKEIAQRRQQIHREQSLRQRKHITLDEIGRRLALGDFQELNLIVKADVGGSVEALSDSLLKLSTEEVVVNIIHKGVGGITESDVMLASASDAVIIGFQVRPSSGSRLLAEREEIDVRTYSIIYDAIADVRDALEGLLSPEETEKILGGVEVREIFKVPRIGTIAGCYVTDGKIHRNDRIRVVREGIVIYEGNISSLKRFKEDVREVVSGYECGIGIENFNDVKVGDAFEVFEIVETKRKLEV